MIYFDVVRPDTECHFSLFRLILDFAPHAFEHFRNLETDVKTRRVAHLHFASSNSYQGRHAEEKS